MTMQSSYPIGDVRSPKRQAVAPAAGSLATRAIMELDDAIWTTIVEFLPIPTGLDPKDDETYAAKVSDIASTWQTLLDLRLVSRKLSALLHPQQNSLWRRLVLQSFDFSCDGSFNVENCQDDHDVSDPDDQEDGDESDEDGETEVTANSSEQNPQLVAMRGQYDADMPEECLEEDLVNWSQIGIYHRPSQYGFLTTLQQQPSQGSWPESESAFTLFGDIVRLLQLPNGERTYAGGEGGDPLVKLLVAPTEKGSSSRYYRFYVLKTLGNIPHFWNRGRGIGGEWKGFTQGEAMQLAITKQLVDRRGRDGTENDFVDDENLLDFPRCSVGAAQQLFYHICTHYRDWRAVCSNGGSDGTTPAFFVGESKALPHRWMGYVGEKTWT